MSVPSKKLVSILEGLMYFFSIVACVAVPLFMDTELINPFILPKQFIITCIAMIGVTLWLVRSVLTKKIVFYQSALDKIFVPLCGALVISALFSDSRLISFVGRADFFTLNIFFLVSCWALFAFINHTVTSLPRWQGMLDALMGIGTITALGVAAKVLVKADALAALTGGRWSTIDPTNSLLGMWLVIIFLIAASQLIKKGSPITRTLLCIVTMLAAFTTLLIMNYTIIWWLLIVGLALCIGVSVLYIREVRIAALTALFGTVVALIIMMVLGFPRISETTMPTEVVLNSSSSWMVSRSSVLSGFKNSLFGNGIGTYLQAFSRFRDSSFNNDPYAWSVRFNQPYSTFTAIVAEGGLVTSALFLILILYVVGLLGKAIKHARSMQGNTVAFFADGSRTTPPLVEVLLLGIVWLIITAGMFLFLYGPVMWWLWWVVLACLMIGLSFSEDNLFIVKEHRLSDKPEYTLALSFVAISIVALMAVGGIWSGRWYFAEKAFARAYVSNDPVAVEKELHAAIALHNSNEQYHVALARLFLAKATQLSQVQKPDIQEIGKLVEQAVSASRQATDLAPKSVIVWENLGMMYENAATLIPEARAWAIKSYDQASQLEPTNPVLVAKLGDNQALNGNLNEAVKKLEEAIILKRDYAPAYASLGLVYEQLKDLEKAAQTYASLVSLQPSNIEYAFNYARFLYNRNATNDRATAEQIWLNIVAAEPRYSNAIYSLALLYEARGSRSKALDYYRKVLELNPGNKDIKTKITNLSR